MENLLNFLDRDLHDLSIADRATIANMAPEYGATCGFFPLIKPPLDYLRLTGRDEQTIALLKPMLKHKVYGMTINQPEPVFTDSINSRFITTLNLVLQVLNVHKIKLIVST